jgi:hypothetical protein
VRHSSIFYCRKRLKVQVLGSRSEDVVAPELSDIGQCASSDIPQGTI